MYLEARILTAGEAGLVVEFSDQVDRTANLAARLLDRRLAAAVEQACPNGGALRGTVVTYRSLLVLYEPLRLHGLDLRQLLAELADEALRDAGAADAQDGQRPGQADRGRLVELPVCYEGELAPDLDEVAGLTGKSREEIIRLHASCDYLVYMLGFQIGYPYLASLPTELRLPRLTRPRLKTPQGSVAIAGELTGIYSLTSPGGWRVLGTTPVPMWDLAWSPPTLLEAGDRVRFLPVDRAEFERMKDLGYVPSGLRQVQSSAACQESSVAVPGGSIAEPDEPVLRVIRPGLLSTVQDLGRPGLWRYGLGPGGAMDRFALRVGNRLLGQAEGAAGLEVTVGGASFEFTRETDLVWTGAAGRLRLGGLDVEPWMVLRAKAGAALEVDWLEKGARGYLCLAGGLAVAPLMGSRSTNLAAGFGGFAGRALQAGDHLAAYRSDTAGGGCDHRVGMKADLAVVSGIYEALGCPIVRLSLVPGPQDDAFGADAWQALLAAEYRVANDSNRMGYRLDGPAIAAVGGHDIVSDGLTEGAVQVPGNGQPVLLMADHQTTGGYSKIGVVPAADLPVAAQVRPGQAIRFELTDQATATRRRLALEHAVAEAVGGLRQMQLTINGTSYRVALDELCAVGKSRSEGPA